MVDRPKALDPEQQFEKQAAKHLLPFFGPAGDSISWQPIGGLETGGCRAPKPNQPIDLPCRNDTLGFPLIVHYRLFNAKRHRIALMANVALTLSQALCRRAGFFCLQCQEVRRGRANMPTHNSRQKRSL